MALNLTCGMLYNLPVHQSIVMKLLATSIFVFSCLFAAAQQPSGILNAYAFMREHFAGTIAVDEKGNELPRGVDTINLIYIETRGEMPTISRAWKNGEAFRIRFVPINDKVLELGNRQLDDKKLVLRPKAGNKLWQLQLEQVHDKRAQPALKGYNKNDVILEGVYKKNKFVYTIKDIIMLASIPSY